MAKSVTGSPKISVDGDYDSYARKPRKKKSIKSRGITATAVQCDDPSQPSNKNVEAIEQINTEMPKNDTSPPTGRIGTTESMELDLPVTTFPKTDEVEKECRPTPVFFESLPTRKQAKVELMKQNRREFNEERQTREEIAAAEPMLSRGLQERISDNDAFSPGLSDSTEINKSKKQFSRRATEDVRRNQYDHFIQRHEPGQTNSRSIVKAMIVRSILPPIKTEETGLFHQSPVATETKVNDSEYEITNDKKEREKQIFTFGRADMKYHFQRGSRLRQGSTKYVYRPKSNHSGVYRRGKGDFDDAHHDAIAWRSKVRFGGNPTFYKRPTSPTLGEEALEKKVIDRLPTRQIKKKPTHQSLYSDVLDIHESWRRPPTNSQQKNSMQTDSMCGSVKKPVYAYRIYDETFWQRTFQGRLPQHRIPVHKGRALWQ